MTNEEIILDSINKTKEELNKAEKGSKKALEIFKRLVNLYLALNTNNLSKQIKKKEVA